MSLVVQEIDGKAVLISGAQPVWSIGSEKPLCIGEWQGQPVWAQRMEKESDVPLPYIAELFYGVDAVLDDRLSTLAGLAHQLLHWEEQSRFCSHCGNRLAPIPGTWGKRCEKCSTEHFPHIHPCIIVLVRRDNEFLLARNVNWPPDRFSLVAGFLDFGESLEECVKREVREETGIEVKNIRYVGSQNWPFPSQQMIGFIADYSSGEIRPDGVEVAEARWFTEQTVPTLPGKVRSISRWIINNFAK
jgi:NAD+ diphosphatase